MSIATLVRCLPVMLVCLAGLPSEAHAHCPSKGYFLAEATNQLPGYGTALDTKVCLAISTQTARINADAIVIAQIADARKLQEALVNRLAGMGQCSYATAQGWDLTDISVSFVGPGSAARIRVNVVAKQCVSSFFRGMRVTYDAPLNVTVTSNIVSLRVDVEKSRVFSTETGHDYVLVSGLIKNTIGGRINGALAAPLDLNPYIPAQARALNPTVSQVAFTLQGNKLMLRVHFAGRVEKQDADQLLGTTVGNQVIPPLVQWIGGSIF